MVLQVLKERMFSFMHCVNKLQHASLFTVTCSRLYHVGVPAAFIPSLHLLDIFASDYQQVVQRTAQEMFIYTPVAAHCWKTL